VRAINITLQILKAARFAHRRGIIHRDLKPHNVIVDDADVAKVTDFGIARAGASDMTETGSIMGTAQYLSPEQAQGRSVAAGSDLYSVGIVLYEMLTGRVPFDGEAAVTIALKHVSEAPIPPSEINPAVPPELEQVVLWALNKNPADRPQDADQLIAALDNCLALIKAGAGGQHTASMAALVAGGAAGAAGALAAGALVGTEAERDPGLAGDGSGALLEPARADEQGGRGWRPWLWAGLVALLIAGAATAAYFISRPEQRVVPSVTGEQLNLARTVLQNAGFTVGVIRVPNVKTAGVVIGEEPQAGTRADKNSTVTVTVSQGPGKQSVPSVQGLSETRAKKLIAQAKLKVARVVMAPSQIFPAGQASGTDPAAGTSVPFESGVTLLVSDGLPQRSVPDVGGESESAATTNLTGAGFKVSASTQSSSSVPAGDVISQDPAGGSTAASGTLIRIVVASAPPTGSVPNVVGDPADGAASALTAAGFKVVRKTESVNQASQNGIVITQTPSAGATAKKNSPVTIVVGRYRPSNTSTTVTTTPTTSTTTSRTTSTSTTAGLP
jgi:serine/threonine-protein kinase